MVQTRFSVSTKCYRHFVEVLHSLTGHSAITGTSPALAMLGKCKHLLSLVGASASLVQRQVVLPAVRSCKEAFPDGKARKSPRMSPISDLKSEGLRALRHLPGFVDGLILRLG